MKYKSIFRLFSDDAAYFRLSRNVISSYNLHTLTNGCLIYAAVLLFYTVFTFAANYSSLPLKIMYIVFDGIHLILSVTVFISVKKGATGFRAVQLFSILFESTILCFFLLEGVFASPSANTLYHPIAILLVLLLFIHRVAFSFLVTLIYSVSFSVLVILFKEPQVIENDIYIALATFIAANIGGILIAKMRHNEATALRNYEQISKTDKLTETLNKSALDSVCKELIAPGIRPFIFIIMDLDNFKQVNDQYGHNTGDEVLRMVGLTLKACFSSEDRVGRFGGDEFIIMTEDLLATAMEKVTTAMNRIGALSFSAPGLTVRCSAGIAVRAASDDDQSIFRRADKALYIAKAKGGGEYSIAE